MINTNRIKGRMRELVLTQEEVAAELHMHPSTFNKKLNCRDGAILTVDEASLLGDLLGWSAEQKGEVFFTSNLA